MIKWIYQIVLSSVLYLVKREKSLLASLMSQNAFLWKHLKWNVSLHCPDGVLSGCVQGKYWLMQVRINGDRCEEEVNKCQGPCTIMTAREEWNLLFPSEALLHLLQNWEQKEGREKSYLPPFINSSRANCSTVWNYI